MNVLVACEESQAVAIAFRAAGHVAFSCDLLECSGGHPEWHIKGDALSLLDGYCTFRTQDNVKHSIDGRWDMIIAFPPCTYLSNAGACRLYPKKGQIDLIRYMKGLEAKAFFLCFLNADCPRIAVENPVSSKIYKMPECSQEVQPFMFGHPYTKKTRLWLRGLPPLLPTDLVKPVAPYVPSGTSRKIRSKYGAAARGDDSRNRSKTFPGLAAAMAAQWGSVL